MGNNLQINFATVFSSEISRITIVMAIALSGLCYQVNHPYGKAMETGILEIMARNYVKTGSKPFQLLPAVNLIGGKPNYYLNHPPLVIFQLGLIYKIFGDSELSSRLTMIAWSLLSVLLFYFIVKSEISSEIALWSTWILIFTPLFYYYGRIVNYESFTLFCSLLTIWVYGKCLHPKIGRPKILFTLLLLLSILLGILSDWAYAAVLLGMIIYALILKRGLKLALAALFVGSIAYACLYLSYWKANILMTKYRFPLSEFGGIQSTFKNFNLSYWLLPDFYRESMIRASRCFTPLLPPLFLGGMILIFGRFPTPKKTGLRALTAMFLFSGLVFIILFPFALYYHDWALYPLLPAMALFSGTALFKLPRSVKYPAFILYIAFSAAQFKNFHTDCNLSHYLLGKAIREASNPDEILYIRRGSPLPYYAGLQTQFFNFGPPFRQFILTCFPEFVVIEDIPGQKYNKWRALLSETGYGLLLDQGGCQVWQNNQKSRPAYLLAGQTESSQADGWTKELESDGDRSVLSINRKLLRKQADRLIIRSVNVKPGDRLAGYLRGKIVNPSPRQCLEFAINVINGNQEERIFTKYLRPKAGISETSWFPFLVDLSRYQNKEIDLELANGFYSRNKRASATVCWGNLAIRSQ